MDTEVRTIGEQGQRLRAVCANGLVIESEEADYLAAALFAVGVRYGELRCGDWRLPCCAGVPAVRLNWVLARLSQGYPMPDPTPD